VYVSNVRFFNKATVFTNGYLDLGAAKRTGDFSLFYNWAADSITADPLGVKAETIKLPANLPYTLASTQYMQLNENTVYVLEFDYWSDTNWASADSAYFYAGLFPDDLPSRLCLQAGALPKTTLQRAHYEVSSANPNMQNALVRFVNFGPSSVYVCNVLFYPKYALGQKSVDLNPFRYCGEYLDLETNNYYLRARFYVPSTGRFTSQDPIGAGLNYYTYCNGNPIMMVDPSGLDPVPLRQFIENKGGTVVWDQKTGMATGTLNGITVSFSSSDSRLWWNSSHDRLWTDDTVLYGAFGLSRPTNWGNAAQTVAPDAAFNRNTTQGIWTSPVDAAQRVFGYNGAYDAAFSVCDYNKFISVFTYDQKQWMVEGWRGNYLQMGVGAEIGVYYNTPGSISNKIGQYWAVDDQDMLYMQYALFNGNPADHNQIFSVSGTHWWLNGFRPGIGTIPASDLALKGSITFQSSQMASAFVNGMISTKTDGTFTTSQNGAVVSFYWH